MEDADPAPPLTILVNSLRLKDGGSTYHIIGTIRNDGTEVYDGIDIRATFFDIDGYRHRVAEVECACRLLVPGDSCSYSLEIYADDYVKYKLHPEGVPVQYRDPFALSISSVNVSNDGIGNVQFTGVVRNEYEVTINHALVSAELVAANGQVVSLGSTALLGDIAPGAEVTFNVRVEYEPYTTYRLKAVGIQK